MLLLTMAKEFRKGGPAEYRPQEPTICKCWKPPMKSNIMDSGRYKRRKTWLLAKIFKNCAFKNCLHFFPALFDPRTRKFILRYRTYNTDTLKKCLIK